MIALETTMKRRLPGSFAHHRDQFAVLLNKLLTAFELLVVILHSQPDHVYSTVHLSLCTTHCHAFTAKKLHAFTTLQRYWLPL